MPPSVPAPSSPTQNPGSPARRCTPPPRRKVCSYPCLPPARFTSLHLVGRQLRDSTPGARASAGVCGGEADTVWGPFHTGCSPVNPGRLWGMLILGHTRFRKRQEPASMVSQSQYHQQRGVTGAPSGPVGPSWRALSSGRSTWPAGPAPPSEPAAHLPSAPGRPVPPLSAAAPGL